MVEAAAVEVRARAHCWGVVGGGRWFVMNGTFLQRLWFCRGAYKNE